MNKYQLQMDATEYSDLASLTSYCDRKTQNEDHVYHCAVVACINWNKETFSYLLDRYQYPQNDRHIFEIKDYFHFVTSQNNYEFLVYLRYKFPQIINTYNHRKAFLEWIDEVDVELLNDNISNMYRASFEQVKHYFIFEHHIPLCKSIINKLKKKKLDYLITVMENRDLHLLFEKILKTKPTEKKRLKI